ncbi:hypothetical protein KAJ02_03860 [Candidatus Bipolaricaulota bacterium]|nr:hypothetical protein [Candidatus Bipolaricaulota bacterium]
MRTALLVMLLTTISWGVGAQVSLHADGMSAGKTVLWFYGSQVDTTFDGTLELGGTLLIDDDPLSFSVAGTTYGSGIADTGTLAATLWILFQTTGTLDSGEFITLRGGMHVLGEEADLNTLSFGGGTGTFFLIADLPEESLWISGTLTTTASGSFVPADDPVTMQIEGTGTFTFVGTLLEASDGLIEQLPWDPASWPLETHQALLALVTGVKSEKAPEQTD